MDVFIDRWVELEYERTYKDPPDAGDLQKLIDGYAEVTKETRNVFVVHLALTSYALLALAGVRDQDFYGSGAGVKLPVVDIEVRPSVFFLAMPILAFLVGTWLEVYMGYSRRLRRRIHQSYASVGRVANHDDLLFPWVGTLAYHASPFSQFVRVIFIILSTVATPFVILAYWLRILPLRGGPWDFVSGGIPSAGLIGGLLIVAVLVALLRAHGADTLDRRLGLPTAWPLTSRWQKWRPARHYLVVAAVVVVHAFDLPDRCNGLGLHSCRIDLRDAELSRPPANGLPARGADLRGVDLDGADLTGAYLENADLSGAFLRGATLSGVFLTGANLKSAELQGATFDEAFLEAATLSSAHMEAANLWMAHLEGADLNHAHLDVANLTGAHLESADLMGASLHGADFGGAFLEGAWFDFAGWGGRKSPIEENALRRMPNELRAQVAKDSMKAADFTYATAGDPPIVCGLQSPVKHWKATDSVVYCLELRRKRLERLGTESWDARRRRDKQPAWLGL